MLKEIGCCEAGLSKCHVFTEDLGAEESQNNTTKFISLYSSLTA